MEKGSSGFSFVKGKWNAYHIVLIGAILVGIAIRIYMSFHHFTHVDDIGFINDMMQKKADRIPETDVFNRVWTYAPLQAFFTALLVNRKQSYMLNIFLGRLPSLLCGIFSIFAAFLAIRKNRLNGKAIIFPIMLIALSWENIIYSAQAEPYAIVVLCGFLILFFLQADVYVSWRKSLFTAVCLAIFCYAHFQCFLLVFAYYMALFFDNIKDKGRIKKIIVSSIASFIVTIPCLKMMKDTNMFLRSINWNKGINDRFLFTMPDGNLVERIRYVFEFFAHNLYLIFKYFLTIPNYGYFSIVYTLLLMLFSVLGIVYLFKKLRGVAVYIILDWILMCAMAVRGTFTFGPSRHCLYLFSIMIFSIYGGIACCGDILDRRAWGRKYNGCYTAVLCTALLAFCISIPNEIAERRNPISEEKIRKIAEKYKPEEIVSFYYMNDLYAMHIDGYENISSPVSYILSGWLDRYDKQDRNKKNFLFFSKYLLLNDILYHPPEELITMLNSLGYTDIAGDFQNGKVIYKEEILAGPEVEYAASLYENMPNVLYLYVIQYEAN